ncbi:SPOR domain-containing protein [Massilia agri]|uniref:SPOR domain-containing protein n=1 Tax=Massilia agri TaxID=1886785 RepID=A0ABT2AF34_9BURK|nr:SPOR domain-containing protein [Massilia agri]MCS0594854.1 SPOR domain-containing protein [Massilia agri]
MGLFSFGSKNKQDTARDSGHFVKDDDAAYGQQARAKRASHAGEGARSKRGADPILPEKKRARRRLVGAIALALAAAVGLPMLLDSEPKPLGTDIAINIPAKDKAAPLPVPAASTVDSGEEIVEPQDAAPAEAEVAPVEPPPPPLRTLETPRAEAPAARPEPVKPEPSKPEPKRKPEETHPKVAELETKKIEKPAAKPVEAKPPVAKDEAARAMAILEGKPAVKAAGPSQKYVVQVAALATQEKVNELQGRLRAAGVSSFTEKNGELIRVRVGPYTKEEGEKIRSKLIAMGLSGTMVPL